MSNTRQENSVFMVGATGRRHIPEQALPALERTTREILATLESCRASEVCVCTGMAIGVDSMIARLVLEAREERPDSKLRLCAISPMALQAYEEDFSTSKLVFSGQTELEQFQELWSRADQRLCLRHTQEPLDRVAQYESLGLYLITHCDLLLAYWSGSTSTVKRGGSVDVALQMSRRLGGGTVVAVATPELLRLREPSGECRLETEKLREGVATGDLATLQEPWQGDVDFGDKNEAFNLLRASCTEFF
ncbi:MAG: hypothetical protein Q4G03_06750 [Planctomycetia bacterium]|nr:hypothetical protein [Planctomycetia bacterium]